MRPTRSTLASLAAELANDAPIVEPDDPIGERENFVELLGDQQHGASAIAKRRDQRMNESDAGNVDPSRRLSGDEQLRLAIEFARDDDALLIAAGKAARRVAQAAVADGEFRQRALRLAGDGREAARRPQRENAGSRSRPAMKLSRIEAVRQSPSSARSALR